MNEVLSPELEVFRGDVGVWDATVEITPAPGAAPIVSRGVSTNRLAYGGRWLIVDFENETGFGGHGVYGFDATTRRYTGVWVDPSRTSLVVMEGSYEPKTRTMTLEGTMRKPDGRTVSWREVTETVDADTRIFRSLMPGPDGSEFQMMKVTYRRRQATS